MPCSSTNGVKEMSGFRQTFNISYSQSGHINQTALCVSVDDVETSALLVCKCHDFFFIVIQCHINFFVVVAGCYCICILHWCSGGCSALRAALRLGWQESDCDRRRFAVCTWRSSADVLLLPLVRFIYSTKDVLVCPTGYKSLHPWPCINCICNLLT